MLATFRMSGQSALVFCRAAGVPLATFAIWQRDARRAAARPVFARVAVATSVRRPEASRGPRPRSAVRVRAVGVRAVVRSVAGATLVLDGLEASTVRDLVAMLLAADRAAPR